MNLGRVRAINFSNLKKTRRMHRPFGLLALLMLVCAACSLPSIGKRAAQPAAATATPAVMEQATQAVASQATQAPALLLAPALVEVQPLPLSDITPGLAPVFYFNQPMDRASVESAFQVEPALPARFEWLDDSTLRLLPEQLEKAEALVRFTVGAGARAANGLALAQPVQVEYQAPPDLKITERLPAPDAVEVNPSSAVVIAFNRPVVALGAGLESSPPAFTLLSSDGAAPAGRGEWLNTSTYIFYPQPSLFGGSRYTVQVDPALAAVDGGSLQAQEAGLDWSFSTAAPVVLSLEPGAKRFPMELDDEVVLGFNQPMDPASVEADFSLVRPDGSLVAGTFAWNETFTEVAFKPSGLLERDTNYGVVLFGTARSRGGAPLGQDFASNLGTVAQFGVIETTPAAGEALQLYYGQGSVLLKFSSPVAPGQDLNRLLAVSPAITGQSITRSQDGYMLILSGYFTPSTSYALEIGAQLADRWGAALGLPYNFTFSSMPARPSLFIAGSPAFGQPVFVPYGETHLPAESTNIERLALASGSLTLAEFIQATRDWQTALDWEPLVQARWASLLYPEPDVTEPVDIPLHPSGELLAPGLYFLKIDTLPVVEGAGSAPQMLVVSPTQLVLKTSLRQAFVWAVRVSDHQPVEGAQVTLYDQAAKVVATCQTGAQGICQADLPAVDSPDAAYYAAIGQPGDADFSLVADHWNQGLTSWEFDVPYEKERPDPKVYLYTDRPIYQPGQAVYLRAVVRSQANGRYAPAELKELTIDVVSPYDPVTSQSPVLTTLRLALDAFGSASGVYRLPVNARLGDYSLRVHEVKYAEIAFRVAEYRKPEIDLQVAFAKADAGAGDDLQARVDARYFFGAPAGGVKVSWLLMGERGSPDLPDGLHAGRVDTSWMEPWSWFGMSGMALAEGQALTQPDGTLQITIPAAAIQERLDGQPGGFFRLSLEVTVMDESGLPVSARAGMNLNPSPYYIGLRPEAWVISAGQEMTYFIRTTDWAGGPVADRALFARFSRVTWKEQDNPAPDAPPQYEMEAVEVGSTEFRTSENGEARLAFIPVEPGTFMVEITGDEGAVTQSLMWVSGAGEAVWPGTPNQRLLLRSDAGEYTAGSTAQIFIPNPFADGALALVTVERGQVMRSQVLPIEESSLVLDLPLAEEDAPNVFVSVTLLGRSGGRPDFRVGYLELAVKPDPFLLQMQLQFSPKEPQPGQDLTVTLRVKDAAGSPVQGEFSLALVDKAVLALSGPNSARIEDAFYGRHLLGVQSSYSLAVYSGRSLYLPPGRGGGGGGAGMLAPGLREKFEDTAYWNGALQTDVTGVGQVTLKLPDNLTTWQADIRGLTGDTRVGSLLADLPVSKPLLVRPVTPRFVVVGDHLELAAVVQNNTENALRASVRLEGGGFGLDDLNLAVQVVELPPGGRARVGWWGAVQDVDELALIFSAEAGDLSDSTRPEGGALPVLGYASPQVFGTSGVVPGPGEQVELVSLPRSFTPVGAELDVELSPSLSALVLDGLEGMRRFPRDFTEPVLSHLLPNVLLYSSLRDLQLEDQALLDELEGAAGEAIDRLVLDQNEDGGWGWSAGAPSSPYLSSYVLFGLARAYQVGMFVDPAVIQRAQSYLVDGLVQPGAQVEAWQLDQAAFTYFVLQQSGGAGLDLQPLYRLREKLSPWGKAFLALALDGQSPGDASARSLVADLQGLASRSAGGASWQDPNPAWHSWSTPNFTSAVVLYALARLDPGAQLLPDAVRYLVLSRKPGGAWNSSYESAWALAALVETIRAQGGPPAGFAFRASLNDAPLISGEVSGPSAALRGTAAVVDLPTLRPDAPNALRIEHGQGSGPLYYRAFLTVTRPAEGAPALSRGLTITRAYYASGQDCRAQDCRPVTRASLSDPQPLWVRLALTVPEDMYNVVVEDPIPAGVEVLNPSLKTTQQWLPEGEQEILFDPEDPFARGWGWWLFQDPQVQDDRVRWVVEFLPAGTYELAYRVTPFLAGEFRAIPARAYQYYFPDREAATAGAVLTIED